MENDLYFEPTVFDTLTQSREIQMLKTAVPYMKQSQKKQFALLIKFMELQKAVQLFGSGGNNTLATCEIPQEENNSLNMLNDIRKYATPKEQEMIDTFTNLFSMIALCSEVQS